MNNQWLEFADNVKRFYGKEFVPLHEPTFNDKEVEYVTDCVKTGWVSSVGAYVKRFEEDLAKFVGVKRAVAVVNGTAALHIALKVAGVKAEDEVLMPSLTFIATANAVSYLGAVPHFIDVSINTLGVDADKLKIYLEQIGTTKNNQLYNRVTGRRISAIVPMHTFGHAADIEGLLKVCEMYNLMLIEDAAESLGSYYNGKHTGSFGKVSALSFNGNKIMTTGGGGAIVTDDDAIADYAKHLTTTAKIPHRWAYEHDEIGFNYRMPNINAALGCAQLEKIPLFIQQKRELTKQYEQWLAGIEGVQLFKEPANSRSNYWLQTILLDEQFNRDEVLDYLNEQGVMSRPIWSPMHHLAIYQNCPKSDLSVTNQLNRSVVNIPSTPISEG
ncbi:LegC family aminotransferase [Lysinibacillus sphaericus]|uniref:LegC family aminotransferase n=1 Tax=Lysinibacillus TaxID=400634 RepID=UPI0004DECC64|nr:LegC family aminotransferase [Lysinibacillus sphaericus]MDM5351416.1 LegC family aminotransferase [Lysinibacillus sphaericus]MEB7451895.1 LegC family aminotransferase [Lysinibacillus sphaericus]QPA59389.1 LegC family aminotransferase [Lysinibacillus sphaericus]